MTKDAPDWTNVSPGLALVHDVFGDGKTALKVPLGCTSYAIAAVDIPANNQANSNDTDVERRQRHQRARLALATRCRGSAALVRPVLRQVRGQHAPWPMRSAVSTARTTTGRRQSCYSTSFVNGN